MVSGLFIKVLLSLILGAVIGLERESSNQGDSSIGGIRTFSLIALTGSIAGMLFTQNYSYLGLLLAGSFVLILISYYIIVGLSTKDFGITSELSAIMVFMLGLLIVIDVIPIQITLVIFVILIFILSLKAQTSQLVSGISRHELQSFISYAIIALVVLPILPDYSYKLNDIPLLADIFKGFNVDMGQFATLDLINPRKIWMIVVLITGIDVFGYILGRIVGNKKGFALTSFIAGFVSSTSATQSLAQRSTKTEFVNHLVAAAVLANLASFIQIFLLVGPLNPKWLVSIVPAILIMIVTAAVVAIYFFRKKEPAEETETPSTDKKPAKIFALKPALKFAALLIAVKLVTKICLILFGQSGFVISSVIASFAGIDAIMVNLADMAGGAITFKFAFLTFIMVNATNLFSKTMYSFMQGTKKFAFRFMISSIAIIAMSAIWLLFI